MNPEHEFGICILTERTIWYQDPTNDVEVFIKKLNSLQSQGEFLNFDVGSLFETVNSKFPDILSGQSTSAEHVYRLILIYARSATMPSGFPSSLSSKLLDSTKLYLDALYLHSKPSRENRPQEIYDFLTEIEGKDHTSYFFENSTSIRKFHLHMSHLLAHPYQRPEQVSFKSELHI